MKPDAIKKGDFWTDSAHSYLTALIWFLREEHPDFCTLPHVMALAFQPTADVVALLSTNPETWGTIASLRESVQRLAGLGVDRVLVTCDEDNAGSRATIEKNGGIYEDSRNGKRRYWISTH